VLAVGYDVFHILYGVKVCGYGDGDLRVVVKVDRGTDPDGTLGGTIYSKQLAIAYTIHSLDQGE
jgi:hypothetical protein